MNDNVVASAGSGIGFFILIIVIIVLIFISVILIRKYKIKRKQYLEAMVKQIRKEVEDGVRREYDNKDIERRKKFAQEKDEWKKSEEKRLLAVKDEISKEEKFKLESVQINKLEKEYDDWSKDRSEVFDSLRVNVLGFLTDEEIKYLSALLNEKKKKMSESQEYAFTGDRVTDAARKIKLRMDILEIKIELFNHLTDKSNLMQFFMNKGTFK